MGTWAVASMREGTNPKHKLNMLPCTTGTEQLSSLLVTMLALLQDGTGSGDVDTSEVQKLGDDGTLAGVKGSGKLRVNPDWKNPSGRSPQVLLGCLRTMTVWAMQ